MNALIIFLLKEKTAYAPPARLAEQLVLRKMTIALRAQEIYFILKIIAPRSALQEHTLKNQTIAVFSVTNTAKHALVQQSTAANLALIATF